MILDQLVTLGKFSQIKFVSPLPALSADYSTGRNNLAGKNVLGITQDLLNQYHQWNSPFKSSTIAHTDLQFLTPIEAKQIAYEMYYLHYGLDKVKNLALARHLFDQVFNLGGRAILDLQDILSHMTGKTLENSGIIDRSTQDILNQLTEKQVAELNNQMAVRRLDFYFREVERRPENKYNLRGWIERGCSYFTEQRLCQPYQKKFLSIYKE